MNKLIPLLLASFLAACESSEVVPDAMPLSFVPAKIACSASCPAWANRSDLKVCTDNGRTYDHTTGCMNVVTECYCVRKREPMPAAL